MEKPKPPNGTYQDWLRYRMELSVWEYFRLYLRKPVKEESRG